MVEGGDASKTRYQMALLTATRFLISCILYLSRALPLWTQTPLTISLFAFARSPINSSKIPVAFSSFLGLWPPFFNTQEIIK